MLFKGRAPFLEIQLHRREEDAARVQGLCFMCVIRDLTEIKIVIQVIKL
jgi:hypothetical protein